jgi:hypothetical protein
MNQIQAVVAAQAVAAMAQEAQTLSALLPLTLGFVVAVVGLHAGELVVLALRLRWWPLAGVGVVGCLGVCLVVAGVVVHVLHSGTLHITEVVALLGVQGAVAVCLPPRLVARRLRRAERAYDDWREQQWRHLQHNGAPLRSHG